MKTVQLKCRSHEYNCCKLPSSCTCFREILKETSTYSGNRDSATRFTNKNAIYRICCRALLQRKIACLEFCLRIFPRKNAWITNLKNPDLGWSRSILRIKSEGASLCDGLDQDHWSQTVRIIAHQGNRWIHSGKGFISSFDVSWF